MSSDKVLLILLIGSAVTGLVAYGLHRIGHPRFEWIVFLAFALFAISTIFMK